MCGAVTYRGTIEPKMSACHCDMCLRWTGGPLLAAGPAQVTFDGDDLRVVQSSDFAQRGFCGRCGSSLYYRLTAGKYAGMTTVGFGTLDQRDGFEMTKEWFCDVKPAAYAFEGERERVTTKEIEGILADMLDV